MSLYLDVVCTEANLTSADRGEKAVQVIGEILPYVLARYGVSNQLPSNRIPTNQFPTNRFSTNQFPTVAVSGADSPLKKAK